MRIRWCQRPYSSCDTASIPSAWEKSPRSTERMRWSPNGERTHTIRSRDTDPPLRTPSVLPGWDEKHERDLIHLDPCLVEQFALGCSGGVNSYEQASDCP